MLYRSLDTAGVGANVLFNRGSNTVDGSGSGGVGIVSTVGVAVLSVVISVLGLTLVVGEPFFLKAASVRR